jgi:hypothetical protein
MHLCNMAGLQHGEKISMRGLKLTVAILLMIGSMTSCAPAPAPTDGRPSPSGKQDLIHALQGLHFDRYLVTPEFEPSHAQVQGWDVYHYRTEELQCILGGEYFIMARRGTEADRTVIWLEGGGACWPGRDDCTKEAQFYGWIEEHGLASPDEDNPVRTWNFIYVPYCDGSMHLGDSDADYDGDGVIDHRHWGLRATSAAVRLMKELFPASQRILIAGCSAGGGGTIGATPVVRLMFPDARLYVLNVSGSGLVNPAMTERSEMAKGTWNVGQFIPGDCPRCDEQITYIYSWLLERDSQLRVGLFSSYHDATFCSGWGMAPEAFESLIISTTETIRTDHPDTFMRYFIIGDMHCIDDYSYRVDGVSLWDWVGYLVNEDPRWIDILE